LVVAWWSAAGDIYRAHYDYLGGALDSPVSLATGDQRSPNLAWTGSELVMLWSDISSGSIVRLGRFDEHGALLAATAAVGIGSRHALGASDLGFGVGWASFSPCCTVRYRGVALAGTPAAPDVTLASSAAPAFTLAAAGSSQGYALAWSESTPELTVAIVNLDGALAAAPTTLTRTMAVGRPHVVWTGNDLSVLWREQNDLWHAQLSGLGAVTGNPRLIATGVDDVAVASDGTQLGVTAWFQSTGVIEFRRLTTTGDVLETVELVAASYSAASRVTWTGSFWALVRESTTAGRDLRLQTFLP
jgi:hypothetical protein